MQFQPECSGAKDVTLGIFAFCEFPGYLSFRFTPRPCECRIFSTSHPMMLTIPSPKYYRSLPQNITRPGGELMEVMLTPMVNTTNPATKNTTGKPSLPFFFISDDYSGSQISIQLRTGCPYLIISDPIPFNSTGNIQQGSVVQSYRGYTAAMALQGYNNAQELPGNPNLVPNPPFPSNASWDNWECMNETIGAAIPLMEGYHVPWWTGLVAAFSILVTCVFAGVFGTCWWKRRQKKKRSTPLRE